MPAPHHSFFTGQMPFLPPNQQRQSTKSNYTTKYIFKNVSKTGNSNGFDKLYHSHKTIRLNK